MKERHWDILIGVAKKDNLEFSKDGFVGMRCPCCGLAVKFKLKGLDADPSISPTILKWSYLPLEE